MTSLNIKLKINSSKESGEKTSIKFHFMQIWVNWTFNNF